MRISLVDAYKKFDKYFPNHERFVRFILDNSIKVYLSREAYINGIPVGKPSISLGSKLQDKKSFLLKYFQTEVDDYHLSDAQFHDLWSTNTKGVEKAFSDTQLIIGNIGELEVTFQDLFVAPEEIAKVIIQEGGYEIKIKVPDSTYKTLIFTLDNNVSVIEAYTDFTAKILKVMINRLRSGHNEPCELVDVSSHDVSKYGKLEHFSRSSAFKNKVIKSYVIQKDSGLRLSPRVSVT